MVLRPGRSTPAARSRAGAWPAGRRLLTALLLAMLLPAVCGAAGAPPDSSGVYTTTDEYKLKAAYLFNFAKYVAWPTTRLPAPDSPIVIGVLGPDPFGGRLERTVRGRTIGRHPVQVRRGRRVEELAGCHLLFVSGVDGVRARQVAELLHETPVLTVAETADFLDSGGMIWLGRAGDAVEFDVNLDAVRRAGLSIGARMLASARNVVGSHDGRGGR